MRDGLSARAQTIAESTETSPDWTPWVITGRSAARLNAGLAKPPVAAITADEAAVVKKRRRLSDAPLRMTAIGPPPSNHRGGSCPRRLTRTRHLCDSCVKTSQRAEMRRLRHALAPACRDTRAGKTGNLQLSRLYLARGRNGAKVVTYLLQSVIARHRDKWGGLLLRTALWMREAPLELNLCWRELAIVAKALADGRDMAEIGLMRDIAQRTLAVLASHG